jgi:hypothetical protein
MKSVHRILLLVVLALVLIAMLVPNTVLAFLREEYSWLGRFVNRVEGVWPGVDMDHLVAFSLLGASAGLALPRLGWRGAAAALLAIAGVTEVLQLWVPGRTALVGDVFLDVAGGLAGYSLALALRGSWGRLRRTQPTPPS